MRFVVALAVATSALMMSAAVPAMGQQMASGEQIRAAVSGKVMRGVNSLGSPYTFRINPNGTMSGILGKLDQFDDRGVWTIEADRWCMQWELWSNSQKICYGVAISGDKITRYSPDGSPIETSTLSAS